MGKKFSKQFDLKQLIFKLFLLSCFALLMPLKAPAQDSFLLEYIKADSLRNAEKYEEAMPVLQQLLTNKITDSVKAEVLARIGILQVGLGMKDSAIAYYQKALDIFSIQQNNTKQSRLNANIGDVFLSILDYGKAMQYYNIAIYQAQLSKDSIRVYFSMCEIHKINKNYDKLHDILFDHIIRFQNDLVPDQAYFTSNYLGLYYDGKKAYDSSIHFFRQSLKYAVTDINFTDAYISLSDEYRLKKNYKQSTSYLDSALIINQQSDNDVSRLAIYDTYVQIYNETNNPLKALLFSKMARQLSDSIFNTKQAATLQDLDIKYQSSKKEAANQILSKDNIIQQRNLIFSFIGLGLVALLGAISFSSYKQKQKANHILTSQRNQVQQLANELEIANQTKARLFSTISHDLRSPISSLYALLKINELKGGNTNEDTTAMSQHTIGLLDTLEDLLVWSKTQMDIFTPVPVRVNVYEIFEEVKAFFTTTSSAKRMEILNEANDSLTLTVDENIFRTILRNGISNALSHAPANSTVVLNSFISDNKVICTIQNKCFESDFKNFQVALNNAGVQSGTNGLGLILIKEFSQKINAAVNLTYDGEWVYMQITLPKDA